VATTSSGRSRRPDLWIGCAAALAAAALFRLTGPDAGPAADARATAEPTSGSRIAEATPSPRTTRSRISAPAITASDVEGALAAATPGTQDLVLERKLATWSREDPQAAARFAELQTDPFLREVALRTVAQHWACRDRDAAAAWAGSLGNGADRDVATGAIAIADADPRAALALLSGDGAAEAAARVAVITRWAARDADAAETWAAAQPPSAERDDIVSRLVFLRVQTDAPAAVRLADQMLGPGDARDDAYASIVGPWMNRDPEAARAWAAATDERARHRLDKELVIAGRDPSAD